MQYAFATLSDEYRSLWARMNVTKAAEAGGQARRIISPSAKGRYQAASALTARNGGTPVPWFVIGCLHMRESNANFNTWLHNGDPMRRNGQPAKTVNVPAGRPPNPDMSWEEGAFDALVVCEQLDQIKNWGPEHVAYAAEKFNGFGYRSPSRNIPSPYLWGGTSVQKPGKFVRDGVYDSSVMDPQIGAMAVLKQIMALDPDATFDAEPKEAPVAPPAIDEPAPISPKADDTESEVKPLRKSKSIWGGIGGWLTSVGGSFIGLFEKLDNAYTLTAFLVIVVLATVAAYLVIKGRIDVQGIIKHLSQDDA